LCGVFNNPEEEPMRSLFTGLALLTALTACTFTHVSDPSASSINETLASGKTPQLIYSAEWTKVDSSQEQFEKDYQKCQVEAHTPSSDGALPRDPKWTLEQCMHKLGYH